MFCMSSYIKILKKYAKNKNISNEEFVRLLFDTVIGTLGLKNRDDNFIDLDKSRVSRILSQKDDVPSAMRKALMQCNASQEIKESFDDFCNDSLEYSMLANASNDICALIEDDKNALSVLGKILGNNDPTMILFNSFIEAIKIQNRKEKDAISPIWSRGANAVFVISGDLFKYGFENRTKDKNIVVIPVNTSFDTHVTTKLETEQNPLVSVTTIHGQWIMRYEKSGKSISELDSRINQSIILQGIQAIGKSPSKNAKQTRYPIGTIAIIDEPKAYFYLLAISAFNEKNVAHSSKENIRIAIKSLLSFYDENGQGYPLYIPLLGTGRSRAGMTLQESYDLIIESLKENEGHIQGKIYIVIQDKDYSLLKKEWR